MITEHCLMSFICKDDAFHHIYLVAQPSDSDACNPLCPFSSTYLCIPILLTKRTGVSARLWQQRRGQTSPQQSQHWSDGFVSDLSCWKIMEVLVFVWCAQWCEVDVCFRCPGPLRCDACIWSESLSPFCSWDFPSCMCEGQGMRTVCSWQKCDKHRLSQGLNEKKNIVYFWEIVEREKENKSTCKKITTALGGKTLQCYLHDVEPSTVETAVLIDTLLIVTHSFKITIFHSCSMLHWWQIYGN